MELWGTPHVIFADYNKELPVDTNKWLFNSQVHSLSHCSVFVVVCVLPKIPSNPMSAHWAFAISLNLVGKDLQSVKKPNSRPDSE